MNIIYHDKTAKSKNMSIKNMIIKGLMLEKQRGHSNRFILMVALFSQRIKFIYTNPCLPDEFSEQAGAEEERVT